MKIIKINILAILMMTLLFSLKAEAKWWIFGQSNDEVTVNYMYLNDISYDESGPKVTAYKETLQDGLIFIRGKASVRKGKIGSVRVTINDREKWEEAKLADDGTFEFSFRPEQGRAYVIYVEIMDTAGKTNNIEETRKEVSLSDQNIMAAIREVLDKMMESYRNEDPARFMTHVSEGFANDDATLDSAIRRDFSAFDNINLRYTLNNAASGSKGVYVSLNYNRQVISSKNGQSYSDKGVTEFVFRFGPDGIKVYSMKNPLIFGICDASGVAEGVLRTAYSEKVLVCDAKGNIALVTFQEAIDGNFGEEGAGSLQAKNATLKYYSQDNFEGILFADDDWPITETDFFNIVGDIAFSEWGQAFRVRSGVSGQNMGPGSLDSIKEAPAAGYNPNPFFMQVVQGNVYAFVLPSNKYVLMEVVTLDSGLIPKVIIRYKYQPNGSRNF